VSVKLGEWECYIGRMGVYKKEICRGAIGEKLIKIVIICKT